MSNKQTPDDDFYIDANGCLTEHVTTGDLDMIVHYDDIPESDITTIDGLRCTTALRTVIDLAPELKTAELKRIVRDCLDRKLFTFEEAMARVSEPDMLTRPGAEVAPPALGRPQRGRLETRPKDPGINELPGLHSGSRGSVVFHDSVNPCPAPSLTLRDLEEPGHRRRRACGSVSWGGRQPVWDLHRLGGQARDAMADRWVDAGPHLSRLTPRIGASGIWPIM